MNTDEQRETDPRMHSHLRIGYRVLFVSGGILAVGSLLGVTVVNLISTERLAVSMFVFAFISAVGKTVNEGRTVRAGLSTLVVVTLGLVAVDPFGWALIGPVTVVMALVFFAWAVATVSDVIGGDEILEKSKLGPGGRY